MDTQPTIQQTENGASATKRKRHPIRTIAKCFLWTLWALILFVAAIVTTVYSPWFQDSLRERLVAKLNADPDSEFKLGYFRLGFPLNLQVKDVLYVNNGDTLIQAGSVRGRVAISGLTDGKLNVENVALCSARYQIGAPDSASCMVIRARRAELEPTTIVLSSMDIDVSGARLEGGSLALSINPVDTFTVPETPSDPTSMKIHVGRLDYTDLGFTMNLLPVIDTLTANISKGYLSDIRVDLLKQTVNVGEFKGTALDARYIMPDSTTIASIPVVVPDSTTSAPWTIDITNIDLDKSKALYTTQGYRPLPGLDFSYIEADDLHLVINNFYNQASTVRLPLTLSGRERSGITLDVKGQLDIDSVGLTFNDFRLTTPNLTDLGANGYMSTATELTDPATPLRLALRGNLAMDDAALAFPDFSTIVNRGLRPGALLDIDADVSGRSGDLAIDRLDLGLDGYLTLNASGSVLNVFDPEHLGGQVTFDGTVGDVSPLMKMLMTDASFVVPAMSLDGDVTFGNGDYEGQLTAVTQKGRVALDGRFNGNKERYDATISARDFPVSAFLPTAGIGRVTADIKAAGHGFDFFSRATAADVHLDLVSALYDAKEYRDIRFDGSLNDGHADFTLSSDDEALPIDLTADGNLNGEVYDWNAILKTGTIDLTALGLVSSEAPELTTVSTDLTLDLGFSANMKNIDGILQLNSLDYYTGETGLSIKDLRAIFNTTDSTTNLCVANGDMLGNYSSPMGVDSIMGRVDRLTSILKEDFAAYRINVGRLQQALMPFDFRLDAGDDNIINKYLGDSGMSFQKLSMTAGNDSTLFLTGQVTGFKTATMALDTVDLDIKQHGEHLDILATVNNRPGTFDEWAHVDVKGYADLDKISLNLHQRNIKGDTGFKFGTILTVTNDSIATLRLSPLDPVINYHDWQINAGNFITYNFKTRHLDADLRMKDDISRLALYTEHVHSNDSTKHNNDEDLILQVFDIQLQDWLAINPFAPAIKGNLSAGMRINYEDKRLTGEGTVSLTDLIYGKERVGDFQTDVNILTDAKGLINLKSELWVNGEKSITLNGALNDSTRTSPFNLDLTMIHFPLETVNPFLTGTAKLSGSINGSMDVSGDSSNPRLNGRLDFDSATVMVNMLGTVFELNGDSIPVRDNIVKFNDFTIKGCNNNPLSINGSVNIADISSPQIDLKATASNMQIVNSNKLKRGADVYGKAFIDLNANVKGDMKFMTVDANLDILPGTNVYYVMVGGASTFENRTSEGMVKFVNFNDSAAMASADSVAPPSSIIDINANLNIQTGTTINVDLSTSGQDRVQLQGNGSLNYTSSIIGADRLTGRYNLTGGFIKYSPPLISNLDFNFNPNSYVSFSGDMLNPRLNISATENMRANVSQAGQNSRLIYFDIILNVTGTLNDMNVGFDLATDDDITVANELASMSPTQRASEAMNLLLYNTYTGGSTKATSNLNGNPLYSFLTSQINSWAAQNIKAVDISFGVDQYDKTTNGATSTATSYSYQVSKSLFNDRFKIIVGGNYSTDANADENLANNLINDVSFEYFLNNARTMYVRLFRHTGYESILEGEITQTGVGFVYKKKIDRVADMFIPSRFRRKTNNRSESENAPKPTTPTDSVKPQNANPTDDTLPEYL